MRRLRHFFFPPRDRSLLRRVLPLTLLAAVPLIILLIVPAAWQYSNSPEFCGKTCHTMPPEYNTYLVSPHARILCVDCHIGRGSIYDQFISKAGHSRLLYATLTNNYEFPIMVSEMRPARETCELCHYPEKFSDDSLRSLHRFQDNKTNDPYIIYLLMHTGGGTSREGLGRGIHWHIENKIEFIAMDELQQEIPWIRVRYNDGRTVTYTVEDPPIDTSNIRQYDLNEMDCITCHNRISHLIPQPENLVDAALNRGDLAGDIPDIRSEGVQVLEAKYESTTEAIEAIGSLEEYYKTEYPDYYAESTQKIENAISLLEQLYTTNTYPEQELDWRTHPNNIGHKDWPGCFRCHDGKHFSEDGEAIRLECNLCHSIPQIVHPGEIEPMLPLTTGIEPASHKDTTWISQHHNKLDTSCANCHTIENPGGTSDTSFCSNSGCHGVDWRYAGFDAPALAVSMGIEQQPETQGQLPQGVSGEDVTYQDLQPVFQQQCGMCHGETPSVDLSVTEYVTLMAGSENGPVIVPGAPDESRILAVLTAGHFAQFTDEQMRLLRQWIANGAPEGATAEAAPAKPITYQDLQPALAQSCGGCHGESPTKGLRVTDYASLMAGGEDGLVIVPGSPDESLIVNVLTQGHFGKLTDLEMEHLRQWIAEGAPENPEDIGAGAPPLAEEDNQPTKEATGEPGGGVSYWETQAQTVTPTVAPSPTQAPPPTDEPSPTATPKPESGEKPAISYWETVQ